MEYYIILKYDDGNIDLWGKCSTCFGVFGSLLYLNSENLDNWLNNKQLSDEFIINTIEQKFTEYTTICFGKGHDEKDEFSIYVCKVEEWDDLF